MKSASYRIFTEKKRRYFAPHEKWKSEYSRVVREEGITNVRLSGYLGWYDTNLNFVQTLPPLNNLEVLTAKPLDCSALGGHSIRALHLSGAMRDIDFSSINGLIEVNLDRWDSRHFEGVLSVHQLKTLGLTRVPWKNLAPLKHLVELESLAILYATKLESLDGGRFSKLQHLYLAKCNNLISLKGIDHFRELLLFHAEGLRRLSDISSLRRAEKLKTLTLIDCPAIDSISALGSLSELTSIDLRGTTNIQDGNLQSILALPRLGHGYVFDRAHYTLKNKDLPKDLARIYHPPQSP